MLTIMHKKPWILATICLLFALWQPVHATDSFQKDHRVTLTVPSPPAALQKSKNRLANQKDESWLFSFFLIAACVMICAGVVIIVLMGV